MKDTIYRDDAIKCCRNEWEEEVEERLRLLPSAQTPDVVEVVHGENISMKAISNGGFLCSISFASLGILMAFMDMSRCPNCGADMRGGKDDR